MKLIQSILILSFSLFTSFLFGQNLQNTIAILDLTENNNETNNAQLFSAEYMAKVSGIPYVITAEVEEATNYGMILSSGQFNGSSFSTDEKVLLQNYVQDGGLLLAPRIQDDEMFALFGIDGYEKKTNRYEINWDVTLSDASLKYIDEPEEQTISLGRSTYDAIFRTVGYSTTTARTLASFADASSAVTTNSFGNGNAVSIGLSWKEVILRNQINRDYEAQRITSNGFEPTSDVFSLFVRALFIEHNPFTVWKNTSPGKSSSSVMITHDIDSKTGMDSLNIFVNYENENDIEATYNVTVRYFEDNLMSSFYLNQQSTLDYIQNKGQNIGSHSVGHFFDFADGDVFPLGTTGNTKDSYQPYNDGTVTVGGTLYGECEVSKSVLQEDIDNHVIRTFRAGHLAFHNNLVDVLDDLGYEYNSSISASDVLHNFPYQNKKGRSFSGDDSNVYELPVTISDVFHDLPISNLNVFHKANIWLDVTNKNHANGAPTVLLIHPNRSYKLEGMSYYLDELPEEINLMEMEKFGDYWRAREVFQFESEVTGNELTITIPNANDLNSNISFIVTDGQILNTINVVNESGEALNFNQDNRGAQDVIIYNADFVTNTTNFKRHNNNNTLSVFPNPTSNSLNIKFEIPTTQQIQIELFDLNGKKITNLLKEKLTSGQHVLETSPAEKNIPNGTYFIVMRNKEKFLAKKKIIMMSK